MKKTCEERANMRVRFEQLGLLDLDRDPELRAKLEKALEPSITPVPVDLMAWISKFVDGGCPARRRFSAAVPV